MIQAASSLGCEAAGRSPGLRAAPSSVYASSGVRSSRMDVLTTAYGEEEAARLSGALESLTKTKTSLWALESELSQLSGKE